MPAPKLIAFLSLLFALAGCGTHSVIDSQHWTPVREEVDGAVIEYSLPGGFERGGDQPWPLTHFRRSHTYGVPTRTPTHKPAAETNIDICISDPFFSYGEFKEEFFRGDDPTSVSQFERDWELLVFDSPEDKVMTRFYIRLLDQHRFLFIRGELRGAAYADEGLRRSRIGLIEDVTRTVRTTPAR